VPPLAWLELVPRVLPEVAPVALHRLARPISRPSAPPALLALLVWLESVLPAWAAAARPAPPGPRSSRWSTAVGPSARANLELLRQSGALIRHLLLNA